MAPGQQGLGLSGSGYQSWLRPGMALFGPQHFRGLSRAVVRPGQNATAFAMMITASTMSRTGENGVMAAAGIPSWRANSVQPTGPPRLPAAGLSVGRARSVC